MNIGQKFKNARLELGLQQKTVVEKYNKISKEISVNKDNAKTITNATLSNWEKNIYQPDPDSIAILCNILNIDANSLLGIDEIENDHYSKTILLDDNNSFCINTDKPWENIANVKKNEIIDDIIEESIKLKKENK